jgi:hypothetical protein
VHSATIPKTLTLHIFRRSISTGIPLCTIRLPHELQRIPARARDKVSGTNCRITIDLCKLVGAGLIGWLGGAFVAWIGGGRGYAAHLFDFLILLHWLY